MPRHLCILRIVPKTLCIDSLSLCCFYLVNQKCGGTTLRSNVYRLLFSREQAPRAQHPIPILSGSIAVLPPYKNALCLQKFQKSIQRVAILQLSAWLFSAFFSSFLIYNSKITIIFSSPRYIVIRFVGRRFGRQLDSTRRHPLLAGSSAPHHRRRGSASDARLCHRW